MGHVIGHLGSRVSALLDGQLAPDETERAWAHVHSCHACRDLVEREGWVKTRLAGLSFGGASAPDHLKGSLLGGERQALEPGLDPALVLDRAAAGLAQVHVTPQPVGLGLRQLAVDERTDLGAHVTHQVPGHRTAPEVSEALGPE